MIWPFNRLFWQRLAAWEAAANRGFEAALPSGGSDANHPDAVGDSVADVWTLLRDMDTRRQLPAEIYALEIGVGSGARARLWLDRFKALDDECGTGYYPRLRFLLGDYSPATLETALAGGGSARAARQRARHRRARPVQGAQVPALQDPLHPPDERLRQPDRSTRSPAATASSSSSRCGHS
jgi:hypothetical protein